MVVTYYGDAPLDEVAESISNYDNNIYEKLIPKINVEIKNLKIINRIILISITGYVIYQFRKEITNGISNIFQKGRSVIVKITQKYFK